MVTLDDKFERFSQSVMEKAERSFEEQFAAIEQKNAALLESYKAEVEAKAAELRAKTLNQAQYEKRMKISRAHLGRKRQIMMVKDELMEALMLRVGKELEGFLESDAYLPFLKSILAKAAAEIAHMEGLVLRIRDTDRERYGAELEAELAEINGGQPKTLAYENLPDMHLGGMILLNEKRTIRFDFTLRTMLEDQRGAIGEALHETFDKAGMKDE